MAEEQQKRYAEMLNEYSNCKEKVMKEIYQEIGDPPVIIENFERRIYEAERKRIDSMERYIFGSIEKAVERLSVAIDQLEETRFLAWKEKAEYVKKLTNKNINGFVIRDANLGLFHRLDEFGRLITSAEGKD